METRRYYEKVSGIFLVYDVCDKSSLENLQKYWIPKIIENGDENIELAIIGNKTDLINDRVVTKEDAKQFIQSIKEL